jgi:hypothetical protein
VQVILFQLHVEVAMEGLSGEVSDLRRASLILETLVQRPLSFIEPQACSPIVKAEWCVEFATHNQHWCSMKACCNQHKTSLSLAVMSPHAQD